jgi:hypothetical protein
VAVDLVVTDYWVTKDWVAVDLVATKDFRIGNFAFSVNYKVHKHGTLDACIFGNGGVLGILRNELDNLHLSALMALVATKFLTVTQSRHVLNDHEWGIVFDFFFDLFNHFDFGVFIEFHVVNIEFFLDFFFIVNDFDDGGLLRRWWRRWRSNHVNWNLFVFDELDLEVKGRFLANVIGGPSQCREHQREGSNKANGAPCGASLLDVCFRGFPFNHNLNTFRCGKLHKTFDDAIQLRP